MATVDAFRKCSQVFLTRGLENAAGTCQARTLLEADILHNLCCYFLLKIFMSVATIS